VGDLGKKSVILTPGTKLVLETMGEQIKMARLRRKLSVELVSQRAGISRATLWAVENGAPSVSVGIYAAVLHALSGMDKELLLIAKDDELGRTLQDLNLPIRKRAPQRRGNDNGK
jgi:transcriptional regulator with XRE-family HTH domain